MNNKSFSEGVGLNYPVKIDFDQDDGLYIAEFLDLPGCSATGITATEAYDRAQEAKEQWLRLTCELGLPIPPPSRNRNCTLVARQASEAKKTEGGKL